MVSKRMGLWYIKLMKKAIVYIIAVSLAALCLFGCAARKTEPILITPAPTPTDEAAQAAALLPTPYPNDTPAPDPLRPAEGAYTFAWLSDTQHYSEKNGFVFRLMTAYLRDNRERLGLDYVIFTGDFVQNMGKTEEWEGARAAMDSISDIPHGVLAGNHDVNYSSADYTTFTHYFGADRYQDKPWYGGSYENNRCHFDLITAGKTDYIFVYVGYPVTDDTAAYARHTFNDYPDRVGILCAHDYFKTDVTLSEGGSALYKQVVKKCPNVYMALCGHRYNQACVPAPMDDDGDGTPDRTVYQMIMNYQAAGEYGGNGYIRFMQIDESAGTLTALSYSPLMRDFNYFDTPESQQIKYPADPAFEAYTLPLPWLLP